MKNKIFDTEHLARTYIKMAMPVVTGMLVTLLYNLADTFFISRTGDSNLVAAVSLCSPVFTTLMAFGNIYAQGGSSLISRLLGQESENGAKKVSSFCFYAALATGLVAGALLLLFCTPVLGILGATEETMPHALPYFTVMAFGGPFVLLSFIHTNLVRCEGLATAGMMGSVAGTVLNIILDPILISICNMGALGAALATVAGYILTDLVMLWVLAKKSRYLSVSFRLCQVTGKQLGQILGVGTAAACTNLMQSAAVILMNQSLLPYGNDKIAAMGIVLKINMIPTLILVGFAFSGVPLFGYLYGAGNKEKLKELMGFCIRLLGGMALAFTVLIFFSAPLLVSGFLKTESFVADATLMLRWQVVSSVCVSIVLLTTILFQASGLVLPAFIMSISRQGVMFVAALFVLVRLFGYTGILAAQAAADTASALIGLVLYQNTIGKKENG